MPEMPEVQGLAAFLRSRLLPEGHPSASVADVEVLSFSVLKTARVPVQSLVGRAATSVSRRGKFIALEFDGLFLAMHLARAGWLRWSDSLSAGKLKQGKGPIALRLRLAGDGAAPGFDLTEAGTRKSVAVYVVEDLTDVPGIERLGPEALDVDLLQFTTMIRGHRGQIKGLLRDQSFIAGIGNAYSDEILHAARMSPFTVASSLGEQQAAVLHGSLRTVLETAILSATGKPAKELKDSKRRALKVHGRAGEQCPVCGDTVREVSFADSALQYCPTCQTGGKLLADRRTSKFLK